MNTLEISTEEYGTIEIHENELASITEAHLEMLRMSREQLHRCFEEGKRLMKEKKLKPGDRVRPCADELDGRWQVFLVGHSTISDPL